MRTTFLIVILTVFYSVSPALAAPVQDRVQGTFLGCRLGEDFQSVSNPERWECRDCCRRDGVERVCIEQFKRLRDIRFGGREWGNFNMYFSPGGIFYMVSMNRGFGTPGEAEPEYTSLLADIDSKYGRVKDIRREEGLSADGTRRSVTYTGSDGAVCTVSLERSEAVNNSLYWFVTLTYWREDLRAAAQEEIIREM